MLDINKSSSIKTNMQRKFVEQDTMMELMHTYLKGYAHCMMEASVT
jgi:hypothetical protein